MEDEIKEIIDKYNNIYIAKKAKLDGSVVTSERLYAPIRLNIPNKYEKKVAEEFGYNENLIFSVEFRLNHKTIFWNLKYSYYVDEKYKRTNQKTYYVITNGYDLPLDEHEEKYFKFSYSDAIDYIKNKIIKTYENFQNL